MAHLSSSSKGEDAKHDDEIGREHPTSVLFTLGRSLPTWDELGRVGSALEGVDDPFPAELARTEARRWESGLGSRARRDVSFPLMTNSRRGDRSEVERQSTRRVRPSLGVERCDDSLW